MTKKRLDQSLVALGLVATRSQAESYIKLGKVTINKRVITKPGQLVSESDLENIRFNALEQYVSRAALKLASAADALNLDFADKTVLDVGSSTGGFTDYALQHGAAKVIAVDVGTNQLHPSLRDHPKVELHEKTDIRQLRANQKIDLVVADVSFVSLREILPAVARLSSKETQIVAMVKPQFEASQGLLNKGIIKNEKLRRGILKEFENWARQDFVIVGKADSAIAGSKGNRERFYLLRKT